MTHHFRKGLDGRMRNNNGEIREKRGDTKMGTLKKQYGINFPVRSDMKLDTYRKKMGGESLHKLLKDQ